MKKNKILILRTNIDKKKKLNRVKQLFKENSNIIKWSVDMEDIDKVLRIETTANINENDIGRLLKTISLFGEDLA